MQRRVQRIPRDFTSIHIYIQLYRAEKYPRPGPQLGYKLLQRLSAVMDNRMDMNVIGQNEPLGTVVVPLFDDAEISDLEMHGLTMPDFFANPPPLQDAGFAPIPRPPGLAHHATAAGVDADADRSRSRELLRGILDPDDDSFDLSMVMSRDMSRVLAEQDEAAQHHKKLKEEFEDRERLLEGRLEMALVERTAVLHEHALRNIAAEQTVLQDRFAEAADTGMVDVESRVEHQRSEQRAAFEHLAAADRQRLDRALAEQATVFEQRVWLQSAQQEEEGSRFRAVVAEDSEAIAQANAMSQAAAGKLHMIENNAAAHMQSELAGMQQQMIIRDADAQQEMNLLQGRRQQAEAEAEAAQAQSQKARVHLEATKRTAQHMIDRMALQARARDQERAAQVEELRQGVTQPSDAELFVAEVAELRDELEMEAQECAELGERGTAARGAGGFTSSCTEKRSSDAGDGAALRDEYSSADAGPDHQARLPAWGRSWADPEGSRRHGAAESRAGFDCAIAGRRRSRKLKTPRAREWKCIILRG